MKKFKNSKKKETKRTRKDFEERESCRAPAILIQFLSNYSSFLCFSFAAIVGIIINKSLLSDLIKKLIINYRFLKNRKKTNR